MTSAGAIKHAGLDYTVAKRPQLTYSEYIDPEVLRADIAVLEESDFYTKVGTDTNDVVGVVGRGYHTVQNTDAFLFFDSIAGGKDGVLYETACALGKGEKIFVTAKLAGYIRVGRNDLIEPYLFLTTSQDGYGSITEAFTPVRIVCIVCQNTLNAAMRS